MTMYGASENNYVVLWVRDSDLITLHGYGGNASPFINKTTPGRRRRDDRVAEYMPSLFRVQRSTRVRFANLIDAGRVTPPGEWSAFVAAGNGTDPRHWNTLLRQDGDDEFCTPSDEPALCAATSVLDRPVLWEWTG